MPNRTRPAHAEEAPSPVNTERILASETWRSRTSTARGAYGAAALELAPTGGAGFRVARALRAPVIAGVAACVVAMVIAVGWGVTYAIGAPAVGEAQIAAPANGGGTPRDLGAGSLGEAAGGAGVEDSTDAIVPGQPEPGGAGDAATAKISVHVIGAVKLSGLVEVPQGARVLDVIDAAGGATDAAVLSGVNLARVVADGEQIEVPDAASVDRVRQQGAAGGAPSQAGGGSVSAEGIVSLNTADVAALDTLPRVGPALAQRIIDWRDQNGGFTSIEQLMEVSGIGAKTFEGLRELVRP